MSASWQRILKALRVEVLRKKALLKTETDQTKITDLKQDIHQLKATDHTLRISWGELPNNTLPNESLILDKPRVIMKSTIKTPRPSNEPTTYFSTRNMPVSLRERLRVRAVLMGASMEAALNLALTQGLDLLEGGSRE